MSIAAIGVAVVGGVAAYSSASKAAKAQKQSAASLAASSTESARIAKQIADADRAESTRQYEENKVVSDKVVGAQLEQMQENTDQARDYFDYLKGYRPAERSMLYESMGLNADEAADMESIVSRNEQSKLDDTGYLKGRESEYADLERQLGLTDETVTERVGLSQVPVAAPTKKKKKSFFKRAFSLNPLDHDQTGILSGLFGKKGGGAAAGPSGGRILNEKGEWVDRTVNNGWILDEITKTNPEYAALVGKMSESQKSLLADQLAAELEDSQNQLDYNNKLSTYGTTASKRRAAELDAGKALDEADARVISGSDSEILAARGGEVDAGIGRAIADSQGAHARNLNQSIRQGLRYGMSSDALGLNQGALTIEQARNTAAAANLARDQGIAKERGLAESRLNLRHGIRDDVTAQRSVDWARKLDSTGLARGLPGASAGAYGLALNAGNSAVNNQIQPGSLYQQGINASNNVLLNGRQLQQQGLTSVLGGNNALAQIGANTQNELAGTLVGSGLKYGSYKLGVPSGYKG